MTNTYKVVNGSFTRFFDNPYCTGEEFKKVLIDKGLINPVLDRVEVKEEYCGIATLFLYKDNLEYVIGLVSHKK